MAPPRCAGARSTAWGDAEQEARRRGVPFVRGLPIKRIAGAEHGHAPPRERCRDTTWGGACARCWAAGVANNLPPTMVRRCKVTAVCGEVPAHGRRC